MSLIDSTISLMMQRITEIQLQNNKPDILINVSRNSSGTFDFHKAEDLVEIGRLATSAGLSAGLD